MKNIGRFAIAVFLITALKWSVQAQCFVGSFPTPVGGPAGGGFQYSSTIDCINQGTNYEHFVHFTVPDTFNFLGHHTLDSVYFSNIDNLPCGLCFGFLYAEFLFKVHQQGCFAIEGITTSDAGQYKLAISGKVWMDHSPTEVLLNDSLFALLFGKVILRVKSPLSACAPVDSTSSATYITNPSACPPDTLRVTIDSNQTVCQRKFNTLYPNIFDGIPPYSYAWSSTGDALSCYTCQNPTSTITQNSMYAVTVTDSTGSRAVAVVTYTLNGNTLHTGQQICIVSVDTATARNEIVWEKTPGLGIDSFKIYKESATPGYFQPIRSQPYSDFSTYIDPQSNPQTGSDRYAITTIDHCGESPFGNVHGTMHLTSTVSGNNELTLNWSNYEGFVATTFTIYRGSTISNLQFLAQVSSAALTYTDSFPPTPPVYYLVAVVNPQGCVPTAKTESYSSSLSNILQVNSLSSVPVISSETNVQLYPNPATNQLFIPTNGTPIESISLYNITGQLMQKVKQPEIFTIDVSGFSTGVYMAEIKAKDFMVKKRWVKM